jgi:hypothetical protein
MGLFTLLFRDLDVRAARFEYQGFAFSLDASLAAGPAQID